MSGIKTRLQDLRQTATALVNEEKKRTYIQERRLYYLQKRFSPWMATKLAEEDYKNMNK